jgi:ABC-2 type transport system permease protein
MSTAVQTVPEQHATPYAAVLRTEARLFRREPGALFWVIAFPQLLLIILGSIPSFRKPDDGLGGLRLIDLYVPVLVLIALVMIGLQTMPTVITGYRERGILRRMSTTPVRPAALLGAQFGLNGAAALLSALICLTIGRLVFDVSLPRQPFGYALALLLTAAAALSLGALVTALARTAKVAQAIGTGIFFPSMFCAGLWIPVKAMPDLMAHIVVVTPFGAAASALDQAFAGDWPSWSHLGVLAAWAVVLSAAAARWFRWE